MLTALARLAVLLMPTPPASDKMLIDSAPSVTDVPWSAWILIVPLVPAFSRKYIEPAELLVLTRSISPDEST